MIAAPRRGHASWLALLVAAGLMLTLVATGAAGAFRAADPPTAPGADELQQFWLNEYSAWGQTSDSTGWGYGSRPGPLLAKAQPDECFNGIGAVQTKPPCTTGIPKVNQAYVWGLVKANDSLWFGTAPNVHCLVIGGFLGLTSPHQTDSWVCELGASKQVPPLPAALGDWRPPNIYTYDLGTRTLTNRSPADARFFNTLGLRSAGSFGGVVLLAGPALGLGINVFAFDAGTGGYLGSANLPQYTNIRKFLVAGNALYTGVAKASGGGAVLRWAGDKVHPFLFTEVGTLDGDAAELALHGDRIFVSTWPTGLTTSGLWMSPTVPFDGLTANNATDWKKVWNIGQYDPNQINALTTGGGALASYGGWLYWGTMHVPFLAALTHFDVYGQPTSTEEALKTLFGTHRAIAIFRGRDFGTPAQEIQVLYGNKLLPRYTPQDGWQLVPNLMQQTPKYGPAGFGNFFNNYTWTANVYKSKLYFGTMDWSYLLDQGLRSFLTTANVALPKTMPAFPTWTFGADLWQFDSPVQAAFPRSVSGVGNYTNYGIRTMISDANHLWLGTANPMNLLTDPNDDKPEGGWELLELH